MSDDQYRYDVFISYRWVEPDQTWVRDQLKPALENAGLKVLLDIYDFVPGRDLIQEMTRGSKESRRGLCVISPDYFDMKDRPVNFESLMLRSLDFSGSSSRLIPFIIRKTEVPLYIKDLIPVDWTDPRSHVREWTKLLDLLEAKNRKAPPPSPVPLDNEPVPPPPPPVPPPVPRPRPFPKVWVSVGLVVLFLGLLALGYKAYSGRGVRTIEGYVYRKQPAGSDALDPVANVVVVLSQTTLHSEKTNADGKFVLREVPANASIDLKAKYGDRYYPMGYNPNGTYPVIPRDADTSSRKFVSTPWVQVHEQCLSDDGIPAINFRVYKNDIDFQTEPGKLEAVLKIEMVDAPEAVIKGADVVDTPGDAYKNETDTDRAKSHTWLFNLSKSGLKTHLIVCLGSDNRAAEISSGRLLTYYTLR